MGIHARKSKHIVKLGNQDVEYPATEEPQPPLPFIGDGFEVHGPNPRGQVTVFFLGGEFEWRIPDGDVRGVLDKCAKMVMLYRKSAKSFAEVEGFARRHGLTRMSPPSIFQV
jgi:hypothetical protein